MPSPKPIIPGYLTTAQVAARFKLSRQRISILTRDREIPTVKLGATLLYRIEDIHLFTGRKPGRPPLKHPPKHPPKPPLTARG
jgi:hypothetical protein